MEPTKGRRAGWQTAFDVAVAPRAAFAALRAAPTWGWAFFIAASLAMASTLAMSSVVGYTFERELRAQIEAAPQTAQLAAVQREALVDRQLQIAGTAVMFLFAFVPLGMAVGCALQALVMLIANAIGGGDGTFKAFWALAVNAAVVGSGIGSVALMAIVLLRGRGGFSSAAEIANALPGLGTFVPPGAKAAAAFFGALNVFTLWDGLLLAGGMMVVARLPRGVTIVTALLIVLGTGVFPLLGAALRK
jgi:hypothetical protein